MATKKVLSIYVGNDAIRVAEVQYNGKQVILSNAAEIPTPDNAIQDGYLNDVVGLAEQIRQATFGRNFTTKDVIFTITSKKIASKDVIIPYNKNEKKLKSILQTNSSEYFPMSNSGDYCFAYSVLDDFQDDEGHKSRVNAVAAPADLVRCYMELADELHYNVVSIDYYGNSVIQLLSMQMQPGSVDLVLQIENDITFVNVMRGKTLILQRSVPMGRTGVISALMDVKKISEKDAKTLLSNEMLLDQHVTADEYARSIESLVNGIARIVEYHRTKNPGDVLQNIRIFGEGSAIAGIEKNLQAILGAEVHHFQSLEGVQVKGAASLTAEEVLRYLANIGACIAPLGFSAETNSGSAITVDSKKITQVGLAILAVAVVASGIFTFMTYKKNKDVKQELASIEAQIAQKQEIVDIKARYELALTKLTIAQNFEASTHNDNEYLLDVIAAMEKTLPTEMFIESLNAENGKVTLVFKSGWHMPIKNEVADTIVKLKAIPNVSNLDIGSVSEEQRIVFVENINEVTGEIEVLREEAGENIIGEVISFNLSDEIPEEYKEYIPMEQSRANFTITFDISAPAADDEVEGGEQ